MKKELYEFLSHCNLENLTSDNWEDEIEYYLPAYFESNSGATKGVIYTAESEYVYKIPFLGETDECGGFKSFRNACSPKISKVKVNADYCGYEAELYQDIAAKHPLLAKLFAETEKDGLVDFYYPIYRQPKCSVEWEAWYYEKEDEIHALSPFRYIHYLKHKYKISTNLPDTWLALVAEAYGYIILNLLLKIIKEYNIFDLHGGNVAVFNDKPIIIDYASYNS